MVRWRRPGPEEAFLQATQPASDLVYNLAHRLTATAPDAEDLVQDTYLRAWRAWRTGTRPRRAAPWLATICLNLSRDRARRAARYQESATENIEQHLNHPTDVAAAAVDRVAVEAALARLPDASRIAVILSDVCGLTAREVADVTGCPLGTALSRIHRGRHTLAAQLGVGDPSTMRPDPGGGADASRP